MSTLNFSTCDTVEALTAYAGLAPLPRPSGPSVWHRPAIRHTGNGRRRTAFSMATLSAVQHHPVIKTFYGQLRAAGKPEKVARCAAARKLLHLAWAVVKKDNPLIHTLGEGKKSLARPRPYLRSYWAHHQRKTRTTNASARYTKKTYGKKGIAAAAAKKITAR